MKNPICNFLSIFFLVFSPEIRAERLFQSLFFQPPESAPQEVVMWVNGEPSGKVDLRRNRFSLTQKLEAPGELVLSFTDKVYDDPERYKKFPKVVIKEDWKNFVLLAFPSPANKHLPVRFVAMNLDSSEFKNGDFRFINFLDNKFAGRLGSERFQLDSREIRTFRDFADSNQDVRMQINVWRPEARIKERPLANQLIRYEKDIRVMFFMYSPQGSDRITYLAADIRGL
ncbi:MAG: hypothetical protein ACQKBU_01855 [Verrucomicrobiales bacterium]